MSELVKLILILAGGILILGVGSFVQYKKKKKNQTNIDSASQTNLDSTSQTDIDLDEKKAKEYIQAYKNTYPRESIKQGLKNLGISEDKSENFLNKYFN